MQKPAKPPQVQPPKSDRIAIDVEVTKQGNGRLATVRVRLGAPFILLILLLLTVPKTADWQMLLKILAAWLK